MEMTLQGSIRKMAGGLAVLLHPLVLNDLILGIMVYKCRSLQASVLGLLLCLIVPVAAVWYFSGDLYLRQRKERLKPLAVIAAAFGLFAIYLYLHFGPDYRVFRTAFFSTLMWASILLVSFRFKISMHTTIYGAFLPPLFFILILANTFGMTFSFSDAFVLLLILSGLVLVTWQRVGTGAHTMAEVMAGYVLGITLIVLFQFLYVQTL